MPQNPHLYRLNVDQKPTSASESYLLENPTFLESISPPQTQSSYRSSAAGNQSQDHYLRKIGSFRNRVRNILLPIVRWETPILGRLQRRVRHPILDLYFIQSANLGSHTFYVLLLPISFWFGYPEFGRILVFVLAAGVYLTNFLKDYCCLPRPLSPPLHRLTMSKDAALEYGFPSTHTANAVSVSLLVSYCLSTTASTTDGNTHWPSSTIFFFLHGLNILYIISLVIGRIYCGMHGFLDLIGGAIIGAAIFFWGTPIFRHTLSTVIYSDSYMAFIIIPIVLFLVRIHPEPADDCPCFEDSVAFLGVLMGEVLSEWRFFNALKNAPDISYDSSTLRDYGYINCMYIVSKNHYFLSSGDQKPQILIPTQYILRFALGVLMIGIWKSTMKKVLHFVLPPLWRKIEQIGLSMPRRFYVPASQYSDIPNDKIPDKTIKFFSTNEEIDEFKEKEKESDIYLQYEGNKNTENKLKQNRDIKNRYSLSSFKRRQQSNESVGPQSAADIYEVMASQEYHLQRSAVTTKETLNHHNKLGITDFGVKTKDMRKKINLKSEDTVVFEASPDLEGLSEERKFFCKNGEEERVPKDLIAHIIVPRVRYDVEVITKLIVYAGIAWIVICPARYVFALLNI